MYSIRSIFPAMLAATALLACSPAAPPSAGGASAVPGPGGATSAPAPAGTTGATTAPTSTGGATAAPAVVADLATRFPLPKNDKRKLIYTWTSVDAAASKDGRDESTATACDSSCVTETNRYEGGALVVNQRKEYPPVVEGVLVPVLKPFIDMSTDLAAKLKAGGASEETIVVKGTSYKVIKVTHGGTDAYSWWIQKPYVVKATFTSATKSTTLELDRVE